MNAGKQLTELSPYNSGKYLSRICETMGMDPELFRSRGAASGLSGDRKVTIYDSTLRDGEQMPGVAFTPEQKMRIARVLDGAGVPQIEAGFPAVSASERSAIGAIADAGLDAEILVLCRLRREDIDMCVDCGADMAMLFVATSALHLKYKLKCTPDMLMKRMEDCLQYAGDRGMKVSFSTEDTTRSDFGFLEEVYNRATAFPVERIGVTDTTGCASPEGMHGLVTLLNSKFPGHDISVHCHNDFGLALCNAVAGLRAGASAVTTTIGGVGERAGNVPLEQLVMTLEHLYGVKTGVDTGKFLELRKLVSELTGHPIPANQPFVGNNVFAHESGIHVAAVLRNPFCYECVAPELVGNRQEIILGKHSGETVIKAELDRMGFSHDREGLAAVLQAVKVQGERKGRLSEGEFRELAAGILANHRITDNGERQAKS